jgi:hypothetical protein
MSKEKIQSLTKYSNDLKAKLSEKTLPEKQKNRPATYRAFLEKELAATTATINSLKDVAPALAAKK